MQIDNEDNWTICENNTSFQIISIKTKKLLKA